MNMIDLRSLHSRSLDVVTPLLTPVTGDQLGHSTPCADWTLRQLLEHMIGQNYGFASAGGGLGPAVPLDDYGYNDDYR